MRHHRLLWILALLTLLMIGVMQYHGAALKTPQTPLGILNLEFAGTVQNAARVYSEWKMLLPRAINNVLLDFVFIVCYTWFLSTAVRAVTKLFSNRWRKPGLLAGRGVIIAGFFDVIENVLMLRTLNGHISKEIVASTFMFAAIKFIPIAFAIVYLLLSPVMMRDKRKQDKTLLTDLQ